MRKVEQAIRVFGAAFGVQPAGRSWVRARAAELGGACVVLVVWGPYRWTVRRVPEGEPVFALRRDDGTIERPPWSNAAE
jgi:hypothetical protein